MRGTRFPDAKADVGPKEREESWSIEKLFLSRSTVEDKSMTVLKIGVADSECLRVCACGFCGRHVSNGNARTKTGWRLTSRNRQNRVFLPRAPIIYILRGVLLSGSSPRPESPPSLRESWAIQISFPRPPNSPATPEGRSMLRSDVAEGVRPDHPSGAFSVIVVTLSGTKTFTPTGTRPACPSSPPPLTAVKKRKNPPRRDRFPPGVKKILSCFQAE